MLQVTRLLLGSIKAFPDALCYSYTLSPSLGYRYIRGLKLLLELRVKLGIEGHGRGLLVLLGKVPFNSR